MESAHKQAVKIYVKSKKVAIRSAVLESYSGWFIGPVKTFTRFVVYGDRLDDTQQKMIDYASDLAMSADLPIKVIDVSKLNTVEHFARLILRRVRMTPAIELPEAMFLHMESHDHHTEDSKKRMSSFFKVSRGL